MLKEEALAGTHVISNRAFSGVPKGTVGTIVKEYSVNGIPSGVTVRWHRIKDDSLEDDFSWEDLEFLDIIFPEVVWAQ
jgi:hypothetical protein